MADDLSSTAIIVTREGMGPGPPELQLRLFSSYLHLILENGLKPGAMCFYTDGVKLLVEGSTVLEQLRELDRRGVSMIVCKTCLDYYNIREKLQVGIIGGMADIQAAQALASKVIVL